MLDKYQSETARNMQRWDREDAYQRTVERNLHPLDYEALAREALDGGFTTALDGWRPTRGYVVSTRPDAEYVIQLTRGIRATDSVPRIADALYAFVVDHGHDLRHGYLLGAWRDDNRVVLDLVQVFEDRADALRAGARADQEAIYDVAAGAEIRIPPPFEVRNVLAFDGDEADELQWLDAKADAEHEREED